MNNQKAQKFLEGLISPDELKDQVMEIKTKKETQELPDCQFIVYYVNDKPDTAWQYVHKPKEGGKPYGRLWGYWTSNAEKKESRKFVENKSTNLKLVDFETFMNTFPPNRKFTKIYDSEEDFLLDLI